MSTESNPPNPPQYVDRIGAMLLHCDKICKEARFIATSLPNVDEGAVEHSLRQLHAAYRVFVDFGDEWLSEQEIESLKNLILDAAIPLQHHVDFPPPAAHPPVDRTSGGRGRPRYIIDLDRAVELHDMDISWEKIAHAMGVNRGTLYNHMRQAGRPTSRRPFTPISDEDLDTLVADYSSDHPLTGSVIIRGYLDSIGIHVPAVRVEASLRRVDEVGASMRWHGTVKRRVYKVHGSNALWHHDGNEKLRPWGFYVHGCIDGHSRLIIYLVCSNNKRAITVERLFIAGVRKYGWPSRGRGDFGTENNGVERRLNERWGQAHRAYLRGRSIHNVRIERLWRDVRKDALEFFRVIFLHLQEVGLLDMESALHRICLFIVFQPRIQRMLDLTVESWNYHRVRTAGNVAPHALFQLSRTEAITRGYWTGDPGDRVEDVDDLYGVDGAEPLPPADELAADPTAPSYAEFPDANAEHEARLFVNGDDEINKAREALGDFDINRDDGNFGIDLYCDLITRLAGVL